MKLKVDRKHLTQSRVKDLLNYDSETGLFKSLRTNRFVGSALDGYQILFIDGMSYKAHRIAWFYVHGYMPDGDIDHINHDRGDNRLINLRPATRSQNRCNTRKRKSIFGLPKGVVAKYKKFGAGIYYGGKRISLGSYLTIDEAAHAYNKAAIELFGEFACLNPIGEDK